MIDMGSLGGGGTAPYAMNDAGQVVGTSQRAEGEGGVHAFSWTRRGGMVDLGTLPGGDSSFAMAVGPTGIVVGSSTTRVPGELRAVLWIPRHRVR